MRDLYNNLNKLLLLQPTLVQADTLSAKLDTQDSQGACVIVNVGASGDTLSGSVYFLLELQESDDDVTYTACADADLHKSVVGTNAGTFAKIDSPTEDSAVYATGYKGAARYLKVNINAVGTHTNGTTIAVVGLTSPNHAPGNSLG